MVRPYMLSPGLNHLPVKLPKRRYITMHYRMYTLTQQFTFINRYKIKSPFSLCRQHNPNMSYPLRLFKNACNKTPMPHRASDEARSFYTMTNPKAYPHFRNGWCQNQNIITISVHTYCFQVRYINKNH